MRLTAEIKAYGDAEKITSCFKPEEGKQKRSKYTIKKQEDHVLFQIEAEDSVALRAIMNSITKLLTVHEKMEKV